VVWNLVSYLKEECRLTVFENRVMWRIFGPKREGRREWQETGEDYIMRSFILSFNEEKVSQMG